MTLTPVRLLGHSHNVLIGYVLTALSTRSIRTRLTTPVTHTVYILIMAVQTLALRKSLARVQLVENLEIGIPLLQLPALPLIPLTMGLALIAVAIQL